MNISRKRAEFVLTSRFWGYDFKEPHAAKIAKDAAKWLMDDCKRTKAEKDRVKICKEKRGKI